MAVRSRPNKVINVKTLFTWQLHLPEKFGLLILALSKRQADALEKGEKMFVRLNGLIQHDYAAGSVRRFMTVKELGQEVNLTELGLTAIQVSALMREPASEFVVVEVPVVELETAQ